MAPTPFEHSFWVRDGLLCAGHYPGHPDDHERDMKLVGLLDCGIRRVLSLMEPDEKARGGVAFKPYLPRLRELAAERGMDVEYRNHPIRDTTSPSRQMMEGILNSLMDGVSSLIPTYFHCWGGHGRTSTVVACFLKHNGMSADEALTEVRRLRSPLKRNHHPFDNDQEAFVRNWR